MKLHNFETRKRIFYIEDPHMTGYFGTTMQSIIFRQKNFPRHQFMLDMLSDNANFGLRFFISGNGISVIPKL